MLTWDNDGLQEEGPRPLGRRTIAWFHDESVFYAHDRRRKAWYHKDAPAKLYAKGDGASLMVADFVSADFGWLRSQDELRSARKLLRPGKNWDGYFSSEDILKQADEAMNILLDEYPEFNHVLIYDNASTHLKWADDALSARQMPNNIPKPGHNWEIKVKKWDPATGNIIYQANGKPAKEKIQMGGARFKDGTVQPLYFPPNHEHAGVFKGMAMILEECGFKDMSKVHAECKDFKCAPGAKDCCCRRILYNEPDFMNVTTLLKMACKA